MLITTFHVVINSSRCADFYLINEGQQNIGFPELFTNLLSVPLPKRLQNAVLETFKQKKPNAPGSLRYAYITLFAIRLSEAPT
jgi:hypothetical protein